MIEMHESRADNDAPTPDGLNPTLERIRSNVTRLLHVESNTEREHSTSRKALVHAGKIDNVMDVTAGCDDERIGLSVDDEISYVGIRVRDHGPGIADDVMERLFDAFFTTKPEGNDLGLALSNEVVSEMNGRLSVCNHPGGGAEFRIFLPATRSAA